MEGQSRIVSHARYTGNMGLGEVVLNDDKPDMEWKTMAFGSINSLLFTMACDEAERVNDLRTSD